MKFSLENLEDCTIRPLSEISNIDDEFYIFRIDLDDGGVIKVLKSKIFHMTPFSLAPLDASKIRDFDGNSFRVPKTMDFIFLTDESVLSAIRSVDGDIFSNNDELYWVNEPIPSTTNAKAFSIKTGFINVDMSSLLYVLPIYTNYKSRS